jgi:poly(A) polymerase
VGKELPSLAGSAWLGEPSLQQVLAALAAAGGEARIAGGAVRDALMGEAVGEVDIATTLTPDEMMAAGKAAGFGVHPTGIEHGTVTLVASGRPFEVTTLRRDLETFGRRARVAFTDDWEADARRRDFTINALYCSGEGEIFDPVKGYPDILKERIRFVGNPATRIKEDYLRILRYFRFEARYGGKTSDKASLSACVRLRKGLATLSPERIRQEFYKLLVAPCAAPVLMLMAKNKVLAHILAAVKDLDPVARMEKIDRKLGLPADPLLRLALIAKDAPTLRDRLKLTNAEMARLKAIGLAPAPDPRLRAGEQRAVLYQMGPEAYRDAVRLAWARSRAAPANSRWRQLLELAEHWNPPVFPVNGDDLSARGLQPGPGMGKMLQQLEDWWVASDFKPSKDELLARVGKLG